jgi:hypothetical protein
MQRRDLEKTQRRGHAKKEAEGSDEATSCGKPGATRSW